MCGRRVDGWVLQLDVEDESSAIPEIVDTVLEAHPLQLAPGCSFIGGWRDGINPGADLEFRITRWIPENSIERVIKKISSRGTVRYLDKLRSQGTFDESLLKEYERAQARWKDDPKLEWDPVEKRIVREQIQYLGPKAQSFEETKDKVPLHVVIVRKRGLKELLQGSSPDGVGDYGVLPTWLGVDSRLKNRNVDIRRKAAFHLTKIAPLTFGNEDIGGVGLGLAVSSSGAIIIASVDIDSPLWDKVMPGDIVKSIDDRSAGNIFEASLKLRGTPGQSVSIELFRSGGTREKLTVHRVIIFPSRNRFETTVLEALNDSDPLVAELAVRACRSPNIDHEKITNALLHLVTNKTPRVRLAAIQALQFSLWNGTPD